MTSYSTRLGAETYVFAADAEGTITNWSELEGSRKETNDHDSVMSDHLRVVAATEQD